MQRVKIMKSDISRVEKMDDHFKKMEENKFFIQKLNQEKM